MPTTTWEAIAIILATFLGPIFAVLVTMWREGRNELLKRRTYIFRTLMATRKIAISREHVDALNLVEVDFYGMRSVLTAHKSYIDHLATTIMDDQVWGNRRQDLLAKLLHAVSNAMKMPIGEIDLRNGGYSPNAWGKRDVLEEYVMDVIRGKEAVPIKVVNLPATASPPAPGLEARDAPQLGDFFDPKKK
jgi:hypothetical protein